MRDKTIPPICEPEVIVRAAICGRHHSDDCPSCQSSREMNNNMLDQLRAENAEAQRTIIALVSALEGIQWKSADRDNMEFTARITCWQMDNLRTTLTSTMKDADHDTE